MEPWTDLETVSSACGDQFKIWTWTSLMSVLLKLLDRRLTHWPLCYQGFGPDGGSPTLNSFRTNDFESFLYGSSKHIWMNKIGSCDCIRNNMWVITGSWLRIELKSSQWVVLTLNYQLTVTCLTSRPHTNLKWSFWVVLPNRLPTYKDGTLTAELQKDKNSFKDQILFHLKDVSIIPKIFIWVN